MIDPDLLKELVGPDIGSAIHDTELAVDVRHVVAGEVGVSGIDAGRARPKVKIAVVRNEAGDRLMLPPEDSNSSDAHLLKAAVLVQIDTARRR